MFIVQSADGPQQCRPCHAPYPSVAFEIDILLFSCTTHYIYGKDGEQYTCPLVYVQPFTENEHGAHEDKYRTACVYGAYQSKRQVLKAEITQYPGRKHDDGLDKDEQVCARGESRDAAV